MVTTVTVRRRPHKTVPWRWRAGGGSWVAAALGGSVLVVVACGADDGPSPATAATGGRAGAPGLGGAAPGNDGGSAVGTIFLGRCCVTTFDCGNGLDCLTVDSGVFGEGPPGGYCTVSCDDDPDQCERVSPGATCQALGENAAFGRFCGLGCALGIVGSVGKCHERRDTACVASPTAAPGGVCVPRCNSDTDCCAPGVVCGPARFCNHASGLCATQRATGLRVGAPCTGPEDDACRGRCREVAGTDPRRFVCTEPCTFGASPACGFVPDEGEADAYCFDADDPEVASERVAGDGGWCVAACDCGTDCSAGLLCRGFDDPDVALATGRLGTCVGAAMVGEPLSCEVPASGGTSGVGGADVGTSGGVATGGAGGVPGAAGSSPSGDAGTANTPGGVGGGAGVAGAHAGRGGEAVTSPGGAAGGGGVGEGGVRGGAAGADPRAGANVGGAAAGAPPMAGLPSW